MRLHRPEHRDTEQADTITTEAGILHITFRIMEAGIHIRARTTVPVRHIPTGLHTQVRPHRPPGQEDLAEAAGAAASQAARHVQAIRQAAQGRAIRQAHQDQARPHHPPDQADLAEAAEAAASGNNRTFHSPCGG